ncbi:hypothetical protein [Hymenobacter volaticus]|uniref:Uncharacterized protein n=1 Tax=Hymenobacter volaticus TaxID=2932254 RepID=A0ABY4GAE2_9BACT|nr:hypothetical protein [Hymenobacter volaticus]UOQ67730.1 hypothetical protein MUN86_07670 [Hymenobacter volaticus]
MSNSYTAGSSAKEMDNHFWLMTSMLLLVFALQLAGVIDLKKPTLSTPLVAGSAQMPSPHSGR